MGQKALEQNKGGRFMEQKAFEQYYNETTEFEENKDYKMAIAITTPKDYYKMEVTVEKAQIEQFDAICIELIDGRLKVELQRYGYIDDYDT
ncbi:MAG: hypothetical protein RMJ67_09175 [Elusimicrobiota bacterium]|nr:hypothetical protein [Endomicrobiia bacterium]MDW8166667.1 hypothetical protein [Elusimicrobiota bacterium]